MKPTNTFEIKFEEPISQYDLNMLLIAIPYLPGNLKNLTKSIRIRENEDWMNQEEFIEKYSPDAMKKEGDLD